MKTSLLCVGLAALVAGTASAQSPQALFELSNTPHQKTAASKDALQSLPVPVVTPAEKSVNNTQAIPYKNMWVTDFYPSWENGNDNQTFVYEPASKTTVIVRTNRVFASNSLSGGQVRLYSTNDNGTTWTESEVFNQPGKLLAFASLGVVNPQGAGTKFEDLAWTVFLANYPAPDWRLNGELGLFKPASGQFEFPMAGPDNAPGDMGWNVMGDMIALNEPSPSVFAVNRLRKTNDNGPSQFGVYGVWGYDFDAEDFTTNTVPAAWDISKFVTPDPPTLASTLNTSPMLSSDADGKLYMAVNNIFTAEPSARVPAVSTSEDQGATWGDFVTMPSSVLDAYKTSQGWENIYLYGTYDGDAFVVTGPNKWSYFFRVGQNANNSWVNRDIVEAKYDNGTWTLNKVAEINGFPLEFTRQDSISDEIGTAAWIPAYSLNSRGIELEVAKTADGKNLLLKWIDDNPALVDSGFKQRAYYRTNAGQWIEDELTGINATDVFMASRAVDGSSWSTPLNMTNDMSYDHGTHIPKVIESLTNVPILDHKALLATEYNQSYSFAAALGQLPAIILDASVDYRSPNRVRTAFINSTTVSDVRDEATYSFRVNSISPNPATAEAELAFTMDVPGNVSINVFTSTGVEVLSIFNGVLNSGIHGLTINTEKLASGTYYVMLNVGSQRVSRPLVVVR